MVPLVSTAVSREDRKRAVLLAAMPGACRRIDSLCDMHVVFSLMGMWMGFLALVNSLSALLTSALYWISAGICAMLCAWCWYWVWRVRCELRARHQPIVSVRQCVRWKPHAAGRT